MKPLISIITPVLNNEQFIAKAIENYLSESTSETELIIIDGGSKDLTVEIIKSYASDRNDIKWVSEKDSGQSDAMNKGIRLSAGEYISFLNVDDFYSKGTLLQVTEILKKNMSIKFLVGDCNVWNSKNELVFVNKPSKLNVWHVLSGYYFPVNPTAYFYSKKLHELVGFYKENNHYNMDLEFIIQARLVTAFHYKPIVWGNFRMLPNTKTFNEIEGNLLEKRKQELLKKYFQELPFNLKVITKLYVFQKTFIPKFKLLRLKTKDKIKFELNKLFR